MAAHLPPLPKFDLREKYEDDDGRTWQRDTQQRRYGTGRWKVCLARRSKREVLAENGHNPAALPAVNDVHRIYSTRRRHGGAAAADWFDLRVDDLQHWQVQGGRARKSGWVVATEVRRSN